MGSKCDSLILNYINDPDLQKKCDSYYRKKLAQIPRIKIKERKTYKKKTKTFADSIKKATKIHLRDFYRANP